MVRLDVCTVDVQTCHEVGMAFDLNAKEQAELSRVYAQEPNMATIHHVLQEKYGDGNVSIMTLESGAYNINNKAKYAIAVNMPN